MNPWVFFGLFVAFLAILEFVPVEIVNGTPESAERRPSQGQQRLIKVAWYAVIAGASAGYLLGYEFARSVLSVSFVMAAVAAVLCLASWLGSRFR